MFPFISASPEYPFASSDIDEDVDSDPFCRRVLLRREPPLGLGERDLDFFCGI